MSIISFFTIGNSDYNQLPRQTKEACANLRTAMRGGALVAVQADIDYGLGPFVASGDRDGLKARAAWLLDGKRYLYRVLTLLILLQSILMHFSLWG